MLKQKELIENFASHSRSIYLTQYDEGTDPLQKTSLVDQS